MRRNNVVRLIGYLGKDPREERVNSKSMKVTLSVATNYAVKVNNRDWDQKTRWNYVSVWGKKAQYCLNMMVSGSYVYIEGIVETKQYTDRDNKNVTRTEVTATDVELLREPRGNQHESARNRDPGGGTQNARQNNRDRGDRDAGQNGNFEPPSDDFYDEFPY